MDVLPEITPINCYNVERGKLGASVRWLIGRVYGSSAPDLLLNPLRYNENGTFQLQTSVITALTDASLYSSAAAKIFKNQNLVNQGHGMVLRALAAHSIPLMVSGEEVLIDDGTLSSVHPFNQAAHLAVIDALMTAHMRSIISIEGVVDAVQKYTTVDQREEPMDSVDALLFWINKICLLVRDDIEKSLAGGAEIRPGSQIVVPEMEDLYEDMCDGACVCALVAFYRDDMMNMQDICFNDPMSLADCQFNLLLLKQFCSRLAFNPFHFEVEDILYLHECLQPNINAFLADLFCLFEGEHLLAAVSPMDPSPSRRFVPIQGIPDLRAQNVANRPSRPPKTKYPQAGMTRALSAMSADSLMTTRSGDSLRYNIPKGQPVVNGADTTNFGELTFVPGDRPVTADAYHAGTSYARSDTMPAASIRLALDEKRREHEIKRIMESNMSESDRIEKQKNAFFALMHRLEKPQDSARGRAHSEVGASSGVPSSEITSLKATVQDLKKQLEEMSLQQEHLSRQVGGHGLSHATSQPAIHSALYMPEPMQQPMGNPYATLPHHLAKPTVPSQSGHTYSMPYTADSILNGQPVYQIPSHPGAYIPQQQISLENCMPHMGGAPTYMVDAQGMMARPSTATTSSPPYVPTLSAGVQPFLLHQRPTTVASGERFVPSVPLTMAATTSSMDPSASVKPNAESSFRLHQNNASSSRLDPPLELNHNLTNWGLTYKAGHMSRPQRRTWENGTFIKSEMDLVNQPEIVPHAPTDQDQAQPPITKANISVARRLVLDNVSAVELATSDNALGMGDGPATSLSTAIKDESSSAVATASHQQSPPRDPASPPASVLMKQRLSATGGSQFIVQDVTSDIPSVNMTREMEAKREALFAKTLRRREQNVQKAEVNEAKNAEKRQAEMEKLEAAEQRKLERELKKQRILEDYKRKKLEKELESSGGNQNGRGHSQPPSSSRPKSNVEASRSRTLQRPVRPQSIEDEGGAGVAASARIFVPSTAEPTLKLFSKYVHKSNRAMIINALQYSVFPGAVSDKQRNEVLSELAKSESKHLLLLFRDQKYRYLGVYSWDQQSDTVHRIHGRGPRICDETMMLFLYKYDSGAKTFSKIPAKHLSATIDGFLLQDQYMQPPKIPHSGSSNQ